MKETHFDGSRAGRNFTVDRQVEPLVLDSEVSGLEERRAFLKVGNNVSRFAFEYMEMPLIATDFIPRAVEDDALDYDPRSLGGNPIPEDLEADEVEPTDAPAAGGEPKPYDLASQFEPGA